MPKVLTDDVLNRLHRGHAHATTQKGRLQAPSRKADFRNDPEHLLALKYAWLGHSRL